MEAIIDAIREPLVMLDPGLVIRRASKGFYKKFKTAEHEVTGHHFFDLKKCPWDNPALEEKLQAAARQKAAFEDFEVSCKIPDAGERILLINGQQLEHPGGEALIMVSIEDVTPSRVEKEDLLQSKRILEERIRLAVEATGIGTWEINPATNFLSIDEQARRLFGFGPNEPADYETFYGVLLEEDKPRRNEAFSKARKDGQSGVYEAEYRILKKDTKELRWIRSKGRVFFDDGQSYSRIVGTLMDITPQKMVSDELERVVNERTRSLRNAIHELRSSNNSLEEFAYVASHDLQEPLRKIQTFSQMLEPALSTAGDEKSILYINRIRDASARMSRLIEDMLNYSRLKKTEDTEPTDLREILMAVVSDFDLSIQQKGAEVLVGALPVVEAVPIHINQLFNNLLSNALKFVKEGARPVITVSSARMTADELARYPALNSSLPYAHITFTDNGIGFGQEYAEKVFDIFQRLNGRSLYEGTGIGLAICRKIVANLQGLIYAEAKEGAGAVFHVLLPVVA